MIALSLAGVWSALKTILGIAQTTKEIAEVVVDVVDELDGDDQPVQPLPHKAVAHQQAQIKSAARPFPPPRKR